jgi:hypothetical protein
MTQTSSSKAGRISSLDILTLIAISICVYTFSDISHEGLGHGLAYVLLGGKVFNISSTACSCAADGLSRSAQRIVAAAGPLMNLALSILFWILLRTFRRLEVSIRYSIWLLMTFNGLVFAGYLAVPTLFGFGDWFEFIQGLSPEWLWRISLIIIGFVLYMGVAYVAVHEFEFLQSRIPSERRGRAWTLNLVPYLSGGIAFCISGLFNPVGPQLILISAAAASFGGASALIWMSPWSAGKAPDANTPQSPVTIQRNWWWITVGLIALIFLVAVLGPGITFGHQ